MQLAGSLPENMHGLEQFVKKCFSGGQITEKRVSILSSIHVYVPSKNWFNVLINWNNYTERDF